MLTGDTTIDRQPDVRITARHGVEQTISERLRDVGPLLRLWTRRELRVRYRQSYLRAAWGLLQPMLILATYGVILTLVLDVSSDGAPYLTFAWAGIVPITFVQQSLSLGVTSIQQAGSLISRVWFPREVLPLAVVACAAIDAAIMGAILVVLAWIQIGPPDHHLVGGLAAVAVLVLWTTGITLAAAAVTVFRRDLNHAVPLMLRILFIITPVMYPATLLHGWDRWNPFAAAIEGIRDSLYRGRWPDPVLAIHGGLGLVVLVGGYALLIRLSPNMGDVV